MADLLGTFEQIVLLAVLDLHDEAYGRSILHAVEAALDRNRAIAAGAIYATLDRLEQKGLVASHLEPGTLADASPARSGRVKRFYRLTASGITALNDARSAIDRMWRGKLWPLPTPA